MEQKKQLTVRFPQSVYDYLAKRAKEESKTLNDIVVEITEDDFRYKQTERLLSDIGRIRENNGKQYGVHPDSTDELRQLREADDE